MTGRFAGRGVVVTGSSRGLGRDIAVAFGREGARVSVTYRTREAEAEQTAAMVRDGGGHADLVRLDVRDLDSVREAVRTVEAAGPIAVLVNNAAEVRDHPALTLPPPEWDSVLDVNLSGVYRCCREVAGAMMARRSGAIVNVASVAGLRASPGQANYAASKAGVVGLTVTLAAEFGPYGVRVNAVAPGLLTTGMAARLDRRIVERRLSGIPAGRLGEGAEVAAAVVFLASDEAAYILGQCLTVDGGLSL